VTNGSELTRAVRDGAEGATIEIAAGTFMIDATLEPKAGMTLKGMGMEKSILTGAATWKPSTKTLPDPEMTVKGMDTHAYLIRLKDNAPGITISGLTLRDPSLHDAIFGWGNENLHLHHLHFQDILWAGIRTFSMKKAKIHDCEFIDAGGRWERGTPGLKGGITGGAIFSIWMKDCEISDNHFVRTQMGAADEFYGIKGRQGKLCHIHHNTIEVNFSIEFPFENDEDMEIDHNTCHGTISIPKHAGGPVPASGSTFPIHHNWLKDSYSIEFVRNGVEIDHNLFDFNPKMDHGNTISGFGKAPASGPASFHNNLVNNPGRGVIWINEPYNNLEVRNNHIIARTTATPRAGGLFGFSPAAISRPSTSKITSLNAAAGPARCSRNEPSAAAAITNNLLTNVSDTARYANPMSQEQRGLAVPLKFECASMAKRWSMDGTRSPPVTKSASNF